MLSYLNHEATLEGEIADALLRGTCFVGYFGSG